MRFDGNDEDLITLAKQNAMKLGAGEGGPRAGLGRDVHAYLRLGERRWVPLQCAPRCC